MVYYKFKSEKDFHSIPMDGHFISVATLKEFIFESRHLGCTDILVVTNAQTNEEYLDEAMLILKNTSVSIRRVPGPPLLPIVAEQEKKVENKVVETEHVDDVSMKYPEDPDWDDFGDDVYAIPDVLPVVSSNIILEAPQTTSKADENSKIKAFIDTQALDWQRQCSDGYGRGFGRGMGGRGFVRAGLQQKSPPPGYVCHRCKVPGHFIQHCPTNGDPTYDLRMVKPDGSNALPTGHVGVPKPDEAAFEKEMEASQGSAQVVKEEVKQKLAPTEAAKKKKTKKVCVPTNDFQRKPTQDFGADNYMIYMAPPLGYNPYWKRMQPGVDGFVAPYSGAMQMMNYGLGPLDMPFGGGIPHDPFGMQNYMMPVAPPPRHLAELSRCMDMNMNAMNLMNAPPPIMIREQFEGRKADLKRKLEIERLGER